MKGMESRASRILNALKKLGPCFICFVFSFRQPLLAQNIKPLLNYFNRRIYPNAPVTLSRPRYHVAIGRSNNWFSVTGQGGRKTADKRTSTLHINCWSEYAKRIRNHL
jgi:hypothetical protein